MRKIPEAVINGEKKTLKYGEGRVSRHKIKFPSNSQINSPILVPSHTLFPERF